MEVERFNPYLGIVAALLLGVLIVAFSGSVTVVRPAINASTTPASLSVLPSFAFPSLELQDIKPTATTTAAPPAPVMPVPKAAEPKKDIVVTEKKELAPPPTVAPPPASAPVSAQPAVQSSLIGPSSALINALVNIICYVRSGSGLHSISGSGVIIDPKGIILTNAHVAQYFLLADRGAECTIRTGSPAIDSYEGSLIYISPIWVQANPNVLTEEQPSGTGEYDFALVAITRSATTARLPSPFFFALLATMPPLTDTPVVIASYGAQFLNASQVRSALFPTIAFGSVKEVFTFGVHTIDVLALGGSAAAQEGSSGGGVVDASGQLVGTITTSTVSGATDTRSLNAITASYIRAEYESETGEALDTLLARPTPISIADFAPHIPVLEKIVTAGLP